MNRNDKDFLVQKIRTQYTEKEQTDLNDLKLLDAKVKRPANVFAYVFGSISAIIMGAGMSLVMTDIGKMIGLVGAPAIVFGILIGGVGIVFVCLAYTVYNRIVRKERERIAPEIIRITDELMKR